MNNTPISPSPERPPLAGQRAVRKSVLLLSAAAGLVAIAVVFVASKHRIVDQPPAISPAQNNPVPGTREATPAAQESIPSASRLSVETIPTNADRAAVARELVKRLSEVEMQPGGVTPESAAKWQRDLESLIEQGTAAVPPLQQFFQSRVDVRFDSGPGTNLLHESTLRMALIEVLLNVPSPDNVDLQEQLLHDTTDPDEVALLARQLEAQDPGKYRDLIVWAAQTSLQQARNGQWQGRKTEPLLKVLNKYGVK
jgi:hypothetical protein